MELGRSGHLQQFVHLLHSVLKLAVVSHEVVRLVLPFRGYKDQCIVSIGELNLDLVQDGLTSHPPIGLLVLILHEVIHLREEVRVLGDVRLGGCRLSGVITLETDAVIVVDFQSRGVQRGEVERTEG